MEYWSLYAPPNLQVMALVLSSTDTTFKNFSGSVALVLLLIETWTLSTVKAIGKSEVNEKTISVWRTGEAEVGSELPVSIELPSLLMAFVVIWAVFATVRPLMVKTKSKV